MRTISETDIIGTMIISYTIRNHLLTLKERVISWKQTYLRSIHFWKRTERAWVIKITFKIHWFSAFFFDLYYKVISGGKNWFVLIPHVFVWKQTLKWYIFNEQTKNSSIPSPFFLPFPFCLRYKTLGSYPLSCFVNNASNMPRMRW